MEFYDFPYIGNVIIPTDDFSYFSEGEVNHQPEPNVAGDMFKEGEIYPVRQVVRNSRSVTWICARGLFLIFTLGEIHYLVNRVAEANPRLGKLEYLSHFASISGSASWDGQPEDLNG